MSLSKNTEAIYISRIRYDYILNRMKSKSTTHKTRYYFDIFQHPTTMKYYISHGVNLQCTHKDLILISTEHFDMLFDRDKDFIYTVLQTASKSIVPFRFTIVD